MLWKKDMLFCEISPTCYKISQRKEIILRHIRNFLNDKNMAKEIREEKLPCVVSSFSSNLIKRAPGVNLLHQENKAVNIAIASSKMNGLIIHPGEEFSFWRLVGDTTKRKGYKEGRVIIGHKLTTGYGGGLCNLSNTIHLLVLHSPMDVTEFHSHSDALAPDEGKRVPFSAGTSVDYNNVDYRFRNNTDRDIQLCLWCENEKLYGELRSESEFPWRYELVEEDHHFSKEGEKYYRISKIYKQTVEKETEKVIEKKLVLDNHSEVLFDYELIPKEQIRA